MKDREGEKQPGSDDAGGPVADGFLPAQSAGPGLECGSCTVCCTVLAVVELQKPARRACDHVCGAGCRIYDRRPHDCRAFHCVWMQGAMGPDQSLRPDSLGIMFDCFVEAGSGRRRLIAFEVWNNAFAEPAARRLLDDLAVRYKLELSSRDGAWAEIGPSAPSNVNPA